MSFLKALSRIGLVELNDKDIQKLEARKARQGASSSPAASDGSASGLSDTDELDRLLRETQAHLAAAELGDSHAAPAAPSPEPVVTPSPSLSAASASTSASSVLSGDALAGGVGLEDRALSSIYSAAGIPVAPFTVEQLLKVLDGLKALPAVSRKAAVVALASADDNWSIADVILDAQRKGRALREEQSRLSGVVAEAEAQAAQELQGADEYLQSATAHIRQQIMELEAMLAAEVQQVTEQKAEIKARFASTRDSVSREHARLESEVARISQVPLTFSDSAGG